MIYLKRIDEQNLHCCNKQGYYDDHGLGVVTRYCTEEHIKKIARKQWELARYYQNLQLTPYIHVRVGNVMYEGCQASGWSTTYTDGKEVQCLHCTQMALCTDGKDRPITRVFPIGEIVEFDYEDKS
jgi:hypothetical protein